MKETDYIVIQSQMVTRLKLSGNNLIIFALIHGFSKDGEHVFNGSLDYITKWTNISKRAVIKNLQKLSEEGLICKSEEIKNGVKFCSYRTNHDKFTTGEKSSPLVNKLHKGSEKSSLGGGEKSSPNNTNIDNTSNNKKDTTSVVSKKNAAKAATLARKDKFYQSLIPYVGRYPKEMIRAFFDYWTEPNKSGTKMRFELQKTWEVGLRLATWASKERMPSKSDTGMILKDNSVDKFKNEKGW